MDPFEVLGVDRMAEKKEILQQVMVVLHENKQYDARTVAQAQKTLFSPLARAEAEFMYCLETDFVAGEEPVVPGEAVSPELNLLDVFNGEGSA